MYSHNHSMLHSIHHSDMWQRGGGQVKEATVGMDFLAVRELRSGGGQN